MTKRGRYHRQAKLAILCLGASLLAIPAQSMELFEILPTTSGACLNQSNTHLALGAYNVFNTPGTTYRCVALYNTSLEQFSSADCKLLPVTGSSPLIGTIKNVLADPAQFPKSECFPAIWKLDKRTGDLQACIDHIGVLRCTGFKYKPSLQGKTQKR